MIRFTGVGAMASALYFVIAASLNGFLGLATLPASVIAYASAAVFSYQGHKRLTFKSHGASSELAKFVGATIMGLFLALIIPIMLAGYAPMVSFVTVLIFVPFCSFLMLKFIVFRK